MEEVAIKRYESGLGEIYPYEDQDIYVYNRPIKNLVSNDSKIVSAIRDNFITSRIFANTIELQSSLTDSIIFVDNVVVNGNIKTFGEIDKIHTSVLSMSDSIILLNYSELTSGVTKEKAGFIVDRDNGSNFASLLFWETDDYWHVSNSGMTFKDIVGASKLDSDTSSFDYIDFVGIDTIPNPTGTDIRMYYHSSDDYVRFKDSTGTSVQIHTNHDIYDDYIDTQQKFNDYFGSELMGTSGVTNQGWNYSKLGDSAIHVYMEPDYRLLLHSGTYNLSTKVHLASGILHGRGYHDCIIKVYDTAVGFIGNNVENIEFDRFKIYGSDVYPSPVVNDNPTFYLRDVHNCNFHQVMEQLHSSYLYDMSSCTNLSFRDFINNSAICFKNGENCKFKGYYRSNVGIFESSAGISDGFFNDSILFGHGNWDDVEQGGF